MSSSGNMCEYNFDYLGSSTLQAGATGLGSVQKPAREMYFRFRREGRGRDGQQRTVLLSPSGMSLVWKTGPGGGSRAQDYSMSEVMWWDAVRFTHARGHDKKHFKAAFESIQVSPAAALLSTEHLYCGLEKKHHYLLQLEHPPLFICVLRRPSGLKALECHVFACGSREEALHVVTTLHDYQRLHAQQIIASTSGPFRYEPYRGEPVSMSPASGQMMLMGQKPQNDQEKKQPATHPRSFVLQDQHFRPARPSPSSGGSEDGNSAHTSSQDRQGKMRSSPERQGYPSSSYERQEHQSSSYERRGRQESSYERQRKVREASSPGHITQTSLPPPPSIKAPRPPAPVPAPRRSIRKEDQEASDTISQLFSYLNEPDEPEVETRRPREDKERSPRPFSYLEPRESEGSSLRQAVKAASARDLTGAGRKGERPARMDRGQERGARQRAVSSSREEILRREVQRTPERRSKSRERERPSFSVYKEPRAVPTVSPDDVHVYANRTAAPQPPTPVEDNFDDDFSYVLKKRIISDTDSSEPPASKPPVRSSVIQSQRTSRVPAESQPGGPSRPELLRLNSGDYEQAINSRGRPESYTTPDDISDVTSGAFRESGKVADVRAYPQKLQQPARSPAEGFQKSFPRAGLLSFDLGGRRAPQPLSTPPTRESPERTFVTQQPSNFPGKPVAYVPPNVMSRGVKVLPTGDGTSDSRRSGSRHTDTSSSTGSSARNTSSGDRKKDKKLKEKKTSSGDRKFRFGSKKNLSGSSKDLSKKDLTTKDAEIEKALSDLRADVKPALHVHSGNVNFENALGYLP